MHSISLRPANISVCLIVHLLYFAAVYAEHVLFSLAGSIVFVLLLISLVIDKYEYVVARQNCHCIVTVSHRITAYAMSRASHVQSVQNMRTRFSLYCSPFDVTVRCVRVYAHEWCAMVNERASERASERVSK